MASVLEGTVGARIGAALLLFWACSSSPPEEGAEGSGGDEVRPAVAGVASSAEMASAAVSTTAQAPEQPLPPQQMGDTDAGLAPELWCTDCQILAETDEILGDFRAPPDLLVDLGRWPDCEMVDPTKLGSGEPATCSIGAALEFVNAEGDPSPGDGRIVVGVTASSEARTEVNCQEQIEGGYSLIGRSAGGLSEGNLAIENRNSEELFLVGCAVVVMAGDTGRPVVRVSGGTGAVAVVGFRATGSSVAGFEISNTAAPVTLRSIDIRDSGSGILATRVGRLSVEGMTARDIVRDAIRLRESRNVTIAGATMDRIGESAVDGLRVENLGLYRSSLTAIGDDVSLDGEREAESALRFLDLSGSTVIAETTIDLGATFVRSDFPPLPENHGLEIRNRDVSLELTVHSSRFLNISNDAVRVSHRGDSGSSLSVKVLGEPTPAAEKCQFQAVNGRAITVAQETSGDASTLAITVTNCAFEQAGIGVRIASSGPAEFELGDNVFSTLSSDAIRLRPRGGAEVRGGVRGNRVRDAATLVEMIAGSGAKVVLDLDRNELLHSGQPGAGLSFAATEKSSIDLTITNNRLLNLAPYVGVVLQTSSGSGAAAGPSRLVAALAGNRLTAPGSQAAVLFDQLDRSVLAVRGFEGGGPADLASFLAMTNSGIEPLVIVSGSVVGVE